MFLASQISELHQSISEELEIENGETERLRREKGNK